ncbi:hypothetical protein JAAARDRAFT_27759 [Jaapia argillacea MUCL 33604]|uniref:Uncharacterized protein n=1 Tax=Jaapia argillacea MUCL 33604 TaxID=933084 RepID=A0A067QKU6_9AGAM|nr:hypothetical protein JAAARDRAFT_27759 [Jaapia argillacea MUCL 33604]
MHSHVFSIRTATLIVSLLGTIGNLVVAVELLSLWRSFKWDFENDWEREGSADAWLWGINLVKLAWGLFSAYFAAAATASLIGFVGTLKNIPSYVRFYRDYAVADFSFCAFFTGFAAYESFRTSVRAGVCEELSRQPELLHNMAEMGLNLENCELWFERVSIAFIGAMAVVLIFRLHFLIAVVHYYSQLTRHGLGLPSYTSMGPISHPPSQRVYLLPSPTESSFPVSHHTTSSPSPRDGSKLDNYMVYAPVPLSALSEQQARDLNATEAWITRTSTESTTFPPATPQPRGHSHRHRRHRSGSATGRISLPISPEEGLLPSYEDSNPKGLKA